MFKTRFLSLAAAATLAVGLCPGAIAYNFFGSGYSPYYGGTNWLWLTRSLTYPFYRGAGYNAPYYMANNLLYSATYGLAGAAQNKARQRSYAQYQDQEPYYNPRQRNRPVVLNGYTGDQITYFPPNKTPVVQPVSGPMSAPGMPGLLPEQDGGPGPDQWLVGGPAPQPGSAGALAPHAQPLTTTPQPSLSAPVTAPPAVLATATVPPVAPAPLSVPLASADQASASATAPLAQGFFDLVLSKFDGDLPRALGDRQAYAFARAIGLVDGKSVGKLDLAPDRLELIKKIMKDGAEDPVARVNAVRLLLKH